MVVEAEAKFAGQEEHWCPGIRCVEYPERQRHVQLQESIVLPRRERASAQRVSLNDLLSGPLPLPSGLRASSYVWAVLGDWANRFNGKHGRLASRLRLAG